MNATTETVTLSDRIAALITEEMYTPFAISKVINTILTEESVKEIPSQMMYNYDRNGLIVKGEKSIKKYSKQQVTEFVNKYLTKKLG